MNFIQGLVCKKAYVKTIREQLVVVYHCCDIVCPALIIIANSKCLQYMFAYANDIEIFM